MASEIACDICEGDGGDDGLNVLCDTHLHELQGSEEQSQYVIDLQQLIEALARGGPLPETGRHHMRDVAEQAQQRIDQVAAVGHSRVRKLAVGLRLERHRVAILRAALVEVLRRAAVYDPEAERWDQDINKPWSFVNEALVKAGQHETIKAFAQAMTEEVGGNNGAND